jgi:hypothetical protein
MSFDIRQTFKRFFPGPFEMLLLGVVIFIASLPGIGMVFVDHDLISGKDSFTFLRDASVVLGVALFFLGLSLIFIAMRSYAFIGTTVYRLTHLQFSDPQNQWPGDAGA